MKMMMIDENYKLFGRVKRKTVCVLMMYVLQLYSYCTAVHRCTELQEATGYGGTQ